MQGQQPMAWKIGLVLTVLLLISQAEGQCSEGDVRLEGGSRESEGRVNVCVGGRWGTVCDDGFVAVDASVVCFQLGYSRFDATALYYNGPGSGFIAMDDVRCSGTERRLIDCTHTTQHNCLHLEDVAVECTETVRCVEGAIRLAGGTSTRGRVEVCIYEQWSSLCSLTWTAHNTEVVCRQLGYASTGTVPTLPGGNDLVLYQRRFACAGNEERLVNCSSTPASVCTHNNDVTIQCINYDTCSEGAVRLAAGTEMSGRVEICVSGRWGTVCDDYWDDLDARVVCRQLGFSGVVSTTLNTSNTGSGPIHMDNVACTGSELTLLSCPHSREHNCFHYEDAQVNCQPRVCENGDVELVDRNGRTGDNVLRGRVEVCWNETWGTVCDRGWSVSDATVVCKELGFSRFGASSYSSAYFGQGTGEIFLRDVACNGSEDALFDCEHSPVGDFGSCRHTDDAGASCQNVRCVDGDIRLVDGLSQYEGRLEFCFEETWGTVCDDWWRSRETRVVCRQHGFTLDHLARLPSNQFAASLLIPILLDNVACLGDESKLSNCTHHPIGLHNCGHHEDVNIRCGQCEEYDARLVDGSSEIEGRVEVCVSGRWGTVCDDSWDNSDAVVVCRQLGLPTEGAQSKNGRFFPPNPYLPIVMDRVICNGFESSLDYCSYLGSNAIRECTHNEDAGVRCTLVPPESPEVLIVNNITPRTLNLTWSQPNSTDSHSPVTGYSISCTSHQVPRMTYQTQGRQNISRILTGLQPFTNYNCCVGAESEAGTGQTICADLHTFETVPSGPPLGVTSVPTSPHSLSLSWQPPSSPNGIIREYRINITEVNTSTTWQITSLTSTRRVSGLHPYYIYSIRVTAFTVGEGPYASPVVIQTYQDITSAAPTHLVYLAITSTSIELMWELPPQSHWNGILTHHVIQIRPHATGVTTYITIPMPALTHRVVDLQPFSRFEITVAAATVNGTGPFFSPPLSLRTYPSAPSDPPNNITHEIMSSTTVGLQWSSPTHPNGIISHYILDWRDGLSGSIASTIHYIQQYGVLDLHPYYNYYYRIAAYTVGRGPYSTWTHIQMPEDAPSGPPQSLQATNTEQTTITLSWRPPPIDEQNGVITHYTVTVIDSANMQSSFTTTALSLTISSLVPNSEHEIAVAASTSVGIGPSSAVIRVTTKPLDISGSPRNVMVTVSSHVQLNVSWEPPPHSELNGEIEGYSVIVRETATNSLQNVTTEDVLEWTLTELHPDYQYRIQVAVITDSGLGEYSDAISATTLPYLPSGAPMILGTEVTNYSVFLTWSDLPREQQNGIITGYVIKYRIGTVHMLVETPSSPREYTLMATPHTEYVLAVAAVNSVGQGPFSSNVAVQTEEDDPSHEPINLRGRAISSTSITLQWNPPPTEHHNGIIDSYTVLCHELQSGGTQSRHNTSTTSITINGLHPFYTYSCNVSAVTVGHGPFSDEISITTFEDVPGPIHNLYLVDVGPYHIEISWDPPHRSERNGELRHYMISLTQLFTSFSPVTYTVSPSSTTYIITALHPYTNYNVVVAAVTIGPGITSSFSIRTNETSPSSPPHSINLISDSPQTLLVSWSPPAPTTLNGILRYYTIRLREQTKGVVISLNSTNTQVTVHSLHPYYVYSVSVGAVTVGLGPFSSPETIRMPQAPPSAAPMNLSVVTVGVDYVLLSWLPPPPEHHNGVIMHYQIYLQVESGSGSGLNSTVSTTGPQTHRNIPNLRSNTYYSCSVAAVTVGVGPASEKVYYTTIIESLGRVQGLMAVSESPESISISWQPPVEADSNSEVLNYTVTLTPLGNIFPNEEPIIITTTETDVVIESLHPNYRYQCSVSTRNSAGPGPTETVIERTLQDDPFGPPVNIKALTLSSRTLFLSWGPPKPQEQNGDITQYGINITDLQNVEYTYVVTAEQSRTFTLHPFYIYNYSITAINSVGSGPFSLPATIQMPEDVPTAPPEQISATNQGPGIVYLSWEPPPSEHHNGVITEYIVTIVNTVSQTVMTTNETSIIFSRLGRQKTHNFTVAAMTTVGQGPAGHVLITTLSDGRPPAPTLGQVERISATQIRISWDPISQTDSGGFITNYTVKYYPLDPERSRTRKNVEDVTVYLTTNKTEMVVRELDPITSYSVSVAANNEAGRGTFTNGITVGLFENCNFQLFLSGHIVCQQWVLYHIDTKLEYLSAGLTMDIESMCRCEFSPKFVLFNQPQCLSGHADRIVISGKIVSTDKSSCENIVKLLQAWLEDESEIIVEGVHLKALKQCSVFLDPGDPIACGENIVFSSIAPSQSNAPSESSSSNPVVIYVVIPIIVVVVVLIIILAVCIFTVKCLRRKAYYSPPSGVNMEAIGTSSKGSIDVYDFPVVDGIYETILDLQPPSLPPNMPNPSAKLKGSVSNPYDIHRSSPEKASRSSTSDCADEYILPETDISSKQNKEEADYSTCVNAIPTVEFDKDLPDGYSQLRHAYTGGQRVLALGAAAQSSSSHYQPLMMVAETPAYDIPQTVMKSGVIASQQEKDDARKDDNANVDTEGQGSACKESPLAKEKKSEYANLDSNSP